MTVRSTYHIVLAGPRAVGKTTIGRALAASLSCPFIDLDDRVLATFPEPTVADAWQAHGEAAWRDAECRMLTTVLAEQSSVVALGGGVPTIPDAARSLNEARQGGQAFVVRLLADPATLAGRLSGSPGDRPSLTGASPSDEIAGICAAREEAYEAISDDRLDVGEMDVDAIVASIRSMVNK